MCGIAGIVSLDAQPILPPWPYNMGKALRHRGPDDEGYVFFCQNEEKVSCVGGDDTPSHTWQMQLPYSPKNNIAPSDAYMALVHRRLSILDVSAYGHQPMCDASRRFWISFNGEVYNYQELRQELLSLGHVFFSQTDTEVVLHAYIQWGTQCVQKFNGMWAFVIYDRVSKKLFCSRDRFGVKPFYYSFTKSFFVFASEQKAFFTLPFVQKNLNEEAVFDYLVLGRTEHRDEGFFKGIFELMPGHNLELQISSGSIRVEKYYELPFNTQQGQFSQKEAKKYAENVNMLLQDSVRLRLRSDVAVGACLSGGIDSSALVCMANSLRQSSEPLHVFTAIYPGMEVDESQWASKVVEATHAHWHTVQTKAEDILQSYQDLIYAQDIPFFGSSTLSQYKVMELIARNGIKVTLDGQGADELFSGYPNHFYTSLSHDFSRLLFGNVRYAHRAEKEPMKNFVRFLVRKSLIKWPFQVGYGYLKNSKYDFQLLQKDFWQKHAEQYYQQRQTSSSHLNEVLHHEFTGTQLKYLMRTADRNSMRHSVESRLPFVDDHRLVEYVFGVPSAYKLHLGQSKFLLRESMKGKMPEAVRQRWDKKGFATPEAMWFKNLKGELKTMLDDNLSPFVDVKKLREEWDYIFAQPLAGNTTGISRFVILSLWRKKFGV